MEEDFQDVLLVNNFLFFLILMAKVLMAKVIKINLIVIKECILQLYLLAF